MFPGKWTPTRTHYFLRLLEEKKLLHRHYTQNIDTLERVAGVSPDVIVEAHGSFGEANCVDCLKDFSMDVVKSCITKEKMEIPKCDTCEGIIKVSVCFAFFLSSSSHSCCFIAKDCVFWRKSSKKILRNCS